MWPPWPTDSVENATCRGRSDALTGLPIPMCPRATVGGGFQAPCQRYRRSVPLPRQQTLAVFKDKRLKDLDIVKSAVLTGTHGKKMPSNVENARIDLVILGRYFRKTPSAAFCRPYRATAPVNRSRKRWTTGSHQGRVRIDDVHRLPDLWMVQYHHRSHRGG